MKQVIVLRKDLNMRKGKMVAQGAHASMKATLDNLQHDYVIEWLDGLFTKICVSVNNYQEFRDLHHAILDYNDNCQMGEEVPYSLIVDSGLTEFNHIPTSTAIAVGPAPDEIVDMFTGSLKLQ